MKSFTPELEPINFEEFLSFLSPLEEFKEFVETLRNIARKRGEFLYFVGGVVRDYLLFKTQGSVTLPQGQKDIDIVLEGDLEAFLEEVLKQIKGKVLFKSQFLTFKVKFSLRDHELIVDFITARKETYPDVAVLPIVSPGSFIEDILRRDFTINTLALGLTPPYEEVIVDLIKAKKDLKQGIIKPLHLKSFVDDPTRIFRGTRYATRLNFRFAEEFYQAVEEALKAESLKKLTPTRIYNELELFVKKEPMNILSELFITTCELGVFKELGFNLSKEEVKHGVELFIKVKENIKAKFWTKALLLFFVKEGEVKSLERLNFHKKEIDKVIKALNRLKELNTEEEVFDLLENTENWILFGLISKVKNKGKFIEEYLLTCSSIKPEIDGNTLKSLGVKNGRLIGKILKLIKLKKFKKELKDKKEELEWVKNYVSQL